MKMAFKSISSVTRNGNGLSCHAGGHQSSARVVCISDTHNRFRELTIPNGDIMIHAGDITRRGYLFELKDFNDWLSTLPHKHKLVISGNHELSVDPISKDENPRFQPEDEAEKNLSSDDYKKVLTNCTYLEFSSVNLFGWKIFGFPFSLIHNDTRWAFQAKRGSQEHFDMISSLPSDIDILISHGPPYGVGDSTIRGTNEGDDELRKHVEERIKPKFHIFGHIHESYGIWTNGETTFINAASTGFPRSNLTLNEPIVFDIPINNLKITDSS